MAVHLRLKRMGTHKRPFYRIVAADSRRSRDGRFLEVVGTYNPIVKPAVVQLEEEKLRKWLEVGAVPSDTVRTLITQVGFAEKMQRADSGEDVSDLQIKKTITERPKKTRRMKKASVAAEGAKA